MYLGDLANSKIVLKIAQKRCKQFYNIQTIENINLINQKLNIMENDAPIDPQVYKEILTRLSIYSKRVDRLSSFVIGGGIISIFTSLFISAFAGSLGAWDDYIIRIGSFISAVILTLLSAFNVAKKLSEIRSAWMFLNKAVYRYKNNIITSIELLNAYDEAESMVGPVGFDDIVNRRPQ